MLSESRLRHLDASWMMQYAVTLVLCLVVEMWERVKYAMGEWHNKQQLTEEQQSQIYMLKKDNPISHLTPSSPLNTRTPLEMKSKNAHARPRATFVFLFPLFRSPVSNPRRSNRKARTPHLTRSSQGKGCNMFPLTLRSVQGCTVPLFQAV